MPSSYWTTMSWSTTSTTTSSNTYYVDASKLYGAWKWNMNETKKDKIDECKIEDDELLDLIRDDS